MGRRIDIRAPEARLLVNGVASLILTMGGYGSAWLGYRDYVPTLNKIVWASFSIALFVYWIGVMVAATLRFDANAPPGWKRTRQVLEFGTFIGVNGVTWLFMPYGTTALQHVTLLFSTSYCAATILSSADENAFTKTRIAIVMGGLATVCIVERIELWPYLAIYLVLLASVLMTLDQLVRQFIGDLRVARKVAEDARDARTRFLQAATHDLGQPLQASRLFHEQAVRATSEDDRRSASMAARDAFAAMERLLHAILDHLRLSEGSYTPRVEVLRTDVLCAGIVKQYSVAAQLEGIDLAALPGAESIVADGHLCERILGNLIDNALRHAQARRVRVGARRLTGGGVRLFVADDGIGVDPGERPMLFEDYTQGARHGEGGFGLGLASARRAARAMGGEIAIEQRWRHGSQFFLELPSRG